MSAKVANHGLLPDEWAAASSRNWGIIWGKGTRPTNEVVVSIVKGREPHDVAHRFGAVVVESVNPVENAFELEFPSVDAAVEAMKPLICDDDVRWAGMTTIIDPDLPEKSPQTTVSAHDKMERRHTGARRPSLRASGTPASSEKKP